MRKPLVSCIIPIVKNDPFIDGCISSIKNSTYDNIEIIIVDEGLERSAQRNIGIDRAKGEYYLILDADQRPALRLINECVDIMEKTFVDGSGTPRQFQGIYIPEEIVAKGYFGKLRNWERHFYTSTPIDVVRFVRASICPKFDESMSGPEDSDWDRRIYGLKTQSINKIYHDDQVDFKKYLKKKAYYAKSMKKFSSKNPHDKVLDFKWRCFGVFFEKGKWKRCLKRPDLFACLMILIFIRGIIYKCQKS